jgi:hypothetical protein
MTRGNPTGGTGGALCPTGGGRPEARQSCRCDCSRCNGAGQDVAAECRQRWIAVGREVIRLTPRIRDSDFADIVAEEIAS